MVAGHLQKKKGYWYIVLNLHDEDGKRKTKWIATHLPMQGNRRRAFAGQAAAHRPQWQEK